MRLDAGQIEVVDERMAEVLRGKSPAERLAMGWSMWSYARDMIASVLRQEHPDWDAKRLQQEVARRLSHGAVPVSISASRDQTGESFVLGFG